MPGLLVETSHSSGAAGCLGLMKPRPLWCLTHGLAIPWDHVWMGFRGVL